MIISRTGAKKWTNRHETFTQDIDNLYDLGNNDSGNALDDYNDATKGIQGIISEAIDAGKELRVLGGEWSFTKIAATKGILLNTKPLNLSFHINQNNLSPFYALSADDLYFAQCGVSIKELSDRLRKRNRSLKTSGASNGQTIAGAISTGTHGSAIDIGATPDYVTGLHIIVSPSRHIWLERKNYPVVSDSFLNRIGAEPVRDDELFNAALVSFGGFGFIHGVMIETAPLFLYECHRQRIPADQHLFHLMETLDFTNSMLPHGSERPYHFQTLVNQYDLDNGAYVNAMYKIPYDPTYTPPPVSSPGVVPGDDAPVFIGTITQAIPALVPKVINKLVSIAYPSYHNITGTHGEIFPNFTTHGKLYSMAVAVPLAEVNPVRELLLELNDFAGPFAGIFAFRFVKGTKATLGFTFFNPSCIIELDGVFSKKTLDFFQVFRNELGFRQMTHSFHWGKMLDLNNDRIRKIYGDHKVDAWLNARNEILNHADSKKVFTNDIMRAWGLDG